MKKNTLFSLALLGAIAPVAHAAPSWFEIWKQKKLIQLASSSMPNNIDNIFSHGNTGIDFKKALSNGDSELLQAEKFAKQIETVKKTIARQALQNNFLKTRSIACLFGGSLALDVAFLFIEDRASNRVNNETVDAFLTPGALLAGCFYWSANCIKFIAWHNQGTKTVNQTFNSGMQRCFEIESTFKTGLPEYLKGQGFPEKAIQATMKNINTPGFLQLCKNSAANALKR